MVAYWFRNDLRLLDNVALTEAAQLGKIVPIYVLDEKLLAPSVYGFRRCGPHRMQFILDAVSSLKQNLIAKGSNLIFRVGEPQQVVSTLADELDCSYVVCSKEVSQDDANTEASLSKRLKPENIEFKLIWDNTLHHAQDLPFLMHQMPENFDDYFEKTQNCKIRTTLEGIHFDFFESDFDYGHIPTLQDLGFAEEVASIGILDHIDLEDFSKLRAHLALGVVSPRQVYQLIKSLDEKTPLVEKWHKELFIRDFYRFLALKHGTRLFKEAGLNQDFNKKGLRDRDKLAKWYKGSTENAEINKLMQKLQSEGSLNENQKIKVANYFFDNMGMAWTLGAAYFEHAMIDYDVYENWGMWNFLTLNN